jgi:hypothetical protein
MVAKKGPTEYHHSAATYTENIDIAESFLHGDG